MGLPAIGNITALTPGTDPTGVAGGAEQFAAGDKRVFDTGRWSQVLGAVRTQASWAKLGLPMGSGPFLLHKSSRACVDLTPSSSRR